ncbi:MAG: hypothetical protein CM1200mP20_12440 [Pseudomonadota bacterium]|nr:MAG: hypothetical protein CM1200mP20_12440 [Pseudomonadota bacterium]
MMGPQAGGCRFPLQGLVGPGRSAAGGPCRFVCHHRCHCHDTLTRNDLIIVATVSVLGFALFAVRPVIHSWMMDLAPPNILAVPPVSSSAPKRF